MRSLLFLSLSLIATASPTPQASPKDKPVTTLASAFSTGTKGLPLKTDVDDSDGSGPYKAALFTDPTLRKHTIYVRATPPPSNIELPVVIWGNGLCAATGTFFYNFLMEVASHGFVIISNGAPAATSQAALGSAPVSTAAQPGGWAGTFSSLVVNLQMLNNGVSTATDQTDAVKWVVQPDKTKRFGNLDVENIAAAGQSCGGILCMFSSLCLAWEDEGMGFEGSGLADCLVVVYTASVAEPRIKATVLFNSGYIDRSAKNLALLKG